MKRTISILLLLVLLTACSSPAATATATVVEPQATHTQAPPTATPVQHGLAGEYFNNFTTQGVPSFTRIDSQVDFYWDWDESPAPDIIMTDFSARWTGRMTVPQTDQYYVCLEGDDGVRLWIGGALLIDDWTSPTYGEHCTSGLILETGKEYDISLALYDKWGPGKLSLRWSTESGSINDELVPSDNLFPPVVLPTAAPLGARPEHEVCVPDVELPTTPEPTRIPEPTVIFSGSLEGLQQTALVPADLVGGMPRNVFRIVVVPLGYKQGEIEQKFPARVAMLQNIVDQLGLNVHYAWLNKPLPVEVARFDDGQLGLPNKSVEQVMQMVDALDQAAPHFVVFDVNTQGGGGWRSTIVAGKDTAYLVLDQQDYLDNSLYYLGAKLSLTAGFEHYIDYGDLVRGYHSEFFFADANGFPIVPNTAWRAWFSAHNTRFISTGLTCMGEPLVKPEGAAESVMAEFWTDEEIYNGVTVNPAVFIDFQRWQMNNTIASFVKDQP